MEHTLRNPVLEGEKRINLGLGLEDTAAFTWNTEECFFLKSTPT